MRVLQLSSREWWKVLSEAVKGAKLGGKASVEFGIDMLRLFYGGRVREQNRVKFYCLSEDMMLS